MPSTAHPQGGDNRSPEAHPNFAALLFLCCIPVAAIAAVLVAAGGTKTGLLVPALTLGAMIGILMFLAFWERPLR